jgi:lipoprotein-anchoring transpeptidase ErfK/SrfK
VRRPFLIAAVVTLLVAIGLVVAVLVLDKSANGKIADGVRVGSTDVGGLTPRQARAKVQRELLAPLQQPIVVRHQDRTWRLTAEQAGIQADVAGMVDAAVARSHEGNPLQRAWREATGGRVHATIPAPVTYSKAAVNQLVDRIGQELDQAPKDAQLTYGVTSMGRVAGRDGVALKATTLKRRIKRSIATPGARRRFTATTRVVQPKVTTAELAEQNPVILTVDRAHFKLRLWKNLGLTKTYSIRVGQQGLETPAGVYHIQNKAVDPAWNVPHSTWTGDLAGKVIPGGTPENPLKARWMGIFDGAGIHGIDPSQYGTIGTAASHGCVGMRIPDVEELYDQVPVGTPIYIA